MASWTEEQNRQVIENRDQEPAAKVAAARRVLSALGDSKQSDDNFDRCCDRTDGRPTQQISSRVVNERRVQFDVSRLTREEQMRVFEAIQKMKVVDSQESRSLPEELGVSRGLAP